MTAAPAAQPQPYREVLATLVDVRLVREYKCKFCGQPIFSALTADDKYSYFDPQPERDPDGNLLLFLNGPRHRCAAKVATP